MESDTLARYTDVAIELMINKLLKKGSNRRNIQCKIVGGARIYNDNLNIGQKNIQCAKEILKRENIKLAAEDTGGKSGRSILDFYRDGTLHLRKNGI
jgi:chemotaxis protein CheD